MVRPRGGRAALALTVAATLAVAGCAARRIDNGVFHSEHGYRVTLPGPPWSVVDDSEAELELRHVSGRAGMLASATCRGRTVRLRSENLSRHLLLGLRERETLEEEETSLAGRRGVHMVVEGRMRDRSDRVRIESYTVKGPDCVYDFLYVAAPVAFERERAEFRRFVASFVLER
jgi:hypothetical protein